MQLPQLNSRFKSQVFVFLFLYLDYIYLLTPFSSLYSFLSLHIPVYFLVLSFFNTVTIEPGLIHPSWSKTIEAALSKEVNKELNYLKTQSGGNKIGVMTTRKNKASEGEEFLKNIEVDNSDDELYARAFDIVMSEKKHMFRYCTKCRGFKPEKAHHCSICKRCVLNLDHHNQILSKCIGINNRKHYLLMLFYGFLSYYYMFYGLWTQGFDLLSDDQIIDFGLFCVGLSFNLVFMILGAFILAFHLGLELWGIGMMDYYKGKQSKGWGRLEWRIWRLLWPFREKELRSIKIFKANVMR